MKKIFKRFYYFLFRYKGTFTVFLFVLLVGTILENIDPYFYKIFADSIPQKKYSQLITALLLFIAARIATNIFNTLSRFLGDKVLIPASRDVRTEVFCHIQDLDFAFHANKSTGSLISAFRRGDSAFYSLFDDIHQSILRIVISLGVAFYFFSRINLGIAGLLLLIFTVNTVLSLWLIKINMRKRNLFNKSEDEISGIIADNMINYETVKFFAQEEKEAKRLKSKFEEWFKRLWAYASTFRAMDLSVGTLANIGTLLVFIVVVRKLMAGGIGAGDFVMIATFMTGIYYQFFWLLYRLRDIAKNYVDIQRYFSILDEKIVVEDPIKPARIGKIIGEVNFFNVDFRYPDGGEPVLKNFNLLVKPGESVAFVGRSGAGKTTIVKLLLRFYDVSGGKITIDGVDIRNFRKSQLRSYIGVVPQEPILFNNTIGFNIAYGRTRVSQKEIIEAAKLANLDGFVQSLPLKYETQVGERGIKLSGGQKQRLAIARMILSSPRIIIFDEATSNLDSESERLIQKALWKVAKGRTVLIIAHRLSTVRRAERIIVMDQGGIRETGNHADLLNKKDGLYQYFWHLQSLGGEV